MLTGAQPQSIAAAEALLQQQIRDVLLFDDSAVSQAHSAALCTTLLQQAAAANNESTSCTPAAAAVNAAAPHSGYPQQISAQAQWAPAAGLMHHPQQHVTRAGSSHAMQRTLRHAFESSAAQRRPSTQLMPSSLSSPTQLLAAEASSFALMQPAFSSSSLTTAVDPTARRSLATTEAQLGGLHESLRRFTHARLEQEQLFREALPTATTATNTAAAIAAAPPGVGLRHNGSSPYSDGASRSLHMQSHSAHPRSDSSAHSQHPSHLTSLQWPLHPHPSVHSYSTAAPSLHHPHPSPGGAAVGSAAASRAHLSVVSSAAPSPSLADAQQQRQHSFHQHAQRSMQAPAHHAKQPSLEQELRAWQLQQHQQQQQQPLPGS